MKKISNSCLALTLVSLALSGGQSVVQAATVIYDETFSGSAAVNTLNGTAPNTANTYAGGSNSAVWSSSSWSETGENDAAASAWLQFTPQNGFVYTLLATF